MIIKQPPETWELKFAKLVDRMGTTKVSLVFVFLLSLFTLFGSYLLRIAMNSQIDSVDITTTLALTLVSAPIFVYFFSRLIKQLEHSRLHLGEAVTQLERLRRHDVILNRELQNNIRQLNYEIEQRKNAQFERERMFSQLELQIREKSEQELQARRLSTLTRSIIDASPDLIYYRNEEGRFAGCNRVAEELTGKSEEELLGLTPHEVYDESLAAQVVLSDQEVLEKNTNITEELWLRFADGRKRLFEMRKVPFYDADGQRLGLLAFGRDITDRMRSQQAIEQASKDKTKFVATISHELRTPLNGIVGLSRMLRDTDLNKEQFSWVSTIYASGITLGNIFNDIIDLDKLDRNKVELELKTVHTHNFITEISSIIRLLAADKNLKFSHHLEEPLPLAFEADGTRMRQVLWNLLYNAVKFTQRGSVSLTISSRPLEHGKVELDFVVEDTGMGIPEKELDKIFAMYYQVKNKEFQSATGTGIGLAICKQMIDKMGGQIQVDSKLGKGSRFEIKIPVSISSNRADLEELKVTGLNILLVEDIELNVMVAKALLEKLGQHVSVAMTGQAAIDKVREYDYDLILLDIQLPDMSGFDVAKVLLDEDLVLHTPIVALTANVIKTREEYLKNGMDDVIAKPIKKSRVVSVFNELFASENLLDGPETVIDKIEKKEALPKVIDSDMLTMLIDTIGESMVLMSLDVFNQKIPDYIEHLKDSLTAKDKDEVCSQAHKIKGAAGSVGLSRVQSTANQIQQGDHPAWWENVHDWVEQLDMAIEQDMGVLKDWLQSQQFDD